ncbi:MAG TPA: endonuclease/exonuclease/phosphatase family protein [Chloroflexota bacterium]|nr:endonuclease/exonuclease/phosphatase family protein [Chloroflexota bacterium]
MGEDRGGVLIGLLRFVLAVAALSYALGMGAYFAGLAAGLGRSGSLALLREFTLYLFTPLPLLLLAALVLRARAALVLSLLPLAAFVWAYGPQLVPQSPPAVAGPHLRVLTFNTGGNVGGGQQAPLLRTIQAVDADLVALQEVPPATEDALPDALAATYPYHVGTTDTLVLSRWPLEAEGEFRLQDAGYLAHQVAVSVGDRTLLHTNVHVTRPSYRVRWRRGLVPLVRGFSPGWRDAQVEDLVARLQATDGPRLLTGDFNETEWSYPYERLHSVLGDSFREAGAGFGHTYPSHLRWGGWTLSVPLVRIDYVFHSPELVALHAAVGPDGGSDHLPVVADLAFR